MRSRQGGPVAAQGARPLAPRHPPAKPPRCPVCPRPGQARPTPVPPPPRHVAPCAPASPLAPPGPCAAFCAAFASRPETLGKLQGVRIPLRPLKKNARGCVRSHRAAQPRCVWGVTRGSNEAVRTGAVGCCDAFCAALGAKCVAFCVASGGPNRALPSVRSSDVHRRLSERVL